jgi:hypothetical protein
VLNARGKPRNLRITRSKSRFGSSLYRASMRPAGGGCRVRGVLAVSQRAVPRGLKYLAKR